MTQRFYLPIEPVGVTYQRLLAHMFVAATQVSCVLRDQLGVSENCRLFLSNCHNSLIEEKVVSQWPGTELLDSKARIYLFHPTVSLRAAFQLATSSLYGWLQPDLPEDVTFYRQFDVPLMVSISHEKFCYFDLTAPEQVAFRAVLPELELTDRIPPDPCDQELGS